MFKLLFRVALLSLWCFWKSQHKITADTLGELSCVELTGCGSCFNLLNAGQAAVYYNLIIVFSVWP